MRICAAIMPLAVAAMLAGCTQDQANLVQEDVTLAPGRFAEMNTDMEEGAQLHWSWDADQAMEWDLHSHAGSRVEIHDSGHAANGSGTFTAPAAGTYSLYWHNDGNATIRLNYRVWGEHALVSVLPT